MTSAILVHPDFDRTWPCAADHARKIWAAQGPVEFIRLDQEDRRPVAQVLSSPGSVNRLLLLGVSLTSDCAASLTGLRAVAGVADAALAGRLTLRGVQVIRHLSEGYWGQSVAEYGLALTLCGLRRIPQQHHGIIGSLDAWNKEPANGMGMPGQPGLQFADDPRFASGTLEGKRVRVVGAGNIASRYASYAHLFGADVAAWDPFAAEPCFHRSGARREFFLERLMEDAEILVPMLPLTEGTAGLVSAGLIDVLPRGTLVVLVTRAGIVDMTALRRRVLNDELALAADVFDLEPLPLDDPLLGRHNVVHTPHNAGRTRDANFRYVEALLDQFPAGQ